MDLLEYVVAALSTWFVGFFPYFEIYVAVPAGYAAGLNWFDSFLWASLGNWMAIPFIDLIYNFLIKIRFIKKIIDKSLAGKWYGRIQKYGAWFVLLITPVAGAWTIGVIGKALKYNRSKLWLYSAISIGITGLIIVLLLELGTMVVN